MDRNKRIGCIADINSAKALAAQKHLIDTYNFVNLNKTPDTSCDTVISLGGDGMMLKTLHRYIGTDAAVYGINLGSVGFLLNSYNPDDLLTKIEQSTEVVLHPLEMQTTTRNNDFHRALAINEISLLRETGQTAHIKISVDGNVRIDTLMGDGILLSTSAGSTAYNYAVNGPIIPLEAKVLALTPISPFRPRRWKGALLSCDSTVEFEVLTPYKRPVSSVADSTEIRHVTHVKIVERRDINIKILFEQSNGLRERVLKEQFTP